MNDKQTRLSALYGIALCLTAVAIGAFGAHAFKALLIANQKQAVFELANRYQFYHGLALLLVAALFDSAGSKKSLVIPVWLMFIGTLIFCSSLYLLALLNITWLGAITPIGGVLLIVSWALLAVKVLKFKP